jgi:hypothetical protein
MISKLSNRSQLNRVDFLRLSFSFFIKRCLERGICIWPLKNLRAPKNLRLAGLLPTENFFWRPLISSASPRLGARFSFHPPKRAMIRTINDTEGGIPFDGVRNSHFRRVSNFFATLTPIWR